MSLVSSVAIYFVIWWLVLFLVLPFGVAGQNETGELTPGADPGAPQQPLLVKKALATTVIAAIVFAGVYIYFGVLGLTLEDLIP